MHSKIYSFLIVGLILVSSFVSCKKTKDKSVDLSNNELVKYAQGFDIQIFNDFSVISIYVPNSDKKVKKNYYIFSAQQQIPDSLQNETIIKVPISKLVAGSTSHIPMLEILNGEHCLIGFPNPQYISSEKTVKRIADGFVKNVGNEQQLNTELLFQLHPDILMVSAFEKPTKENHLLEKSGIIILENSDWLEQDPLGRAEWIKVFGILLGKYHEADSIFNEIAAHYQQLKNQNLNTTHNPKVLTGSLFQDIWYTPAGESYLANLITDAHGDYVWSDTKGNGSLSLSPENVLVRAKNAAIWILPGTVTSYEELHKQHPIYQKFDAFQHHNIYTNAHLKGKNGGLIYYELSPLRPDWLLEDLIHIFHPTIKDTTALHFFAPLNLN